MSLEIPNIDQMVAELQREGAPGELASATTAQAATAQAATAQAAGVAVSSPAETHSGVSATAAAPEDVAATTVATTTPSAVPRPRGIQSEFAAQAPWPPGGQAGPGLSPPKPMPKRPQGRILVGAILWMVWDSFIGVAAYGVVTGDTLRVTAPWDGVVQEVLVEEGQVVQKGQLLVLMHSFELERRQAQIEEELRVERARLDGEKARLRWDSQSHAAEYFELWGLAVEESGRPEPAPQRPGTRSKRA